MPLFDPYGVPIRPDTSKTDRQSQTQQSQSPVKRLLLLAIGKILSARKKVTPAWELTIALATIAGLGLAIYVLRPILIASLVPPPAGADKLEAEVTIINSGHIPITNVEVLCQWNKAVFGGRYTFDMHGLVTLSVYSISRLGTGETMTTFCWQPWELYVNRAGGFFSMGRPDIPSHLVPGVDFTFPKDLAHPVLTHPHDVVQWGVSDLSPFTAYRVTAVDAAMVVNYRVFGIKRHHTIHLVSDDLGEIFWRIVPEGTSVPNGNGGFEVSAAGVAMTITIDAVHHSDTTKW